MKPRVFASFSRTSWWVLGGGGRLWQFDSWPAAMDFANDLSAALAEQP